MAERIEELTEAERALLESLYIPCAGTPGRPGHKALRIIDTHAADRAALVARVAELEEDARAGEHRYKLELKRRVDAERNLADCRDELTSAGVAHRRDYDRLSNEATRLREELAAEKAHAADTAAAYAAKSEALILAEARAAELEAEMASLRQALVARAEAAETRVAELEAERDEDYYG